jgi:hypothetical protein
LSNFLRVSPIGELLSLKRISPRWEGKPTSLVDGLASGRRRWSIRRRPIAGPGLVDGLAVSLLGLDVRAAGVVVCHVQVLDHLRADL